LIKKQNEAEFLAFKSARGCVIQKDHQIEPVIKSELPHILLKLEDYA